MSELIRQRPDKSRQTNGVSAAPTGWLSSGSTYFVLSEGYLLAGVPEDPKDYIEYCRKNGVFRKSNVSVPTKAQALNDAALLRKSNAWTDIKWKDSGENWSYTMDEGWAWEFIQKQAEGIR